MFGRIFLKSKVLTRSRGRPAGRVRVVHFDTNTRILQQDGGSLSGLTRSFTPVLVSLRGGSLNLIRERLLWQPPTQNGSFAGENALQAIDA